jgi:hypothetical protein
MKRIFNKISTGVFWLCTLITLVLFICFYRVYFAQTLDVDSPEISVLLSWIFFLLVITFCTGLIFFLFYYIRKWKENPKKARRSIAVVIALQHLLMITWMCGSGNPLPLIGYKGSENTYVWLKLTDMWLYSIYILLGLGFLALFGGIVWSYFKKGS